MNMGVPVLRVRGTPSSTCCAHPKSMARSQVPGGCLQSVTAEQHQCTGAVRFLASQNV
jgi:hypothetical protein